MRTIISMSLGAIIGVVSLASAAPAQNAIESAYSKIDAYGAKKQCRKIGRVKVEGTTYEETWRCSGVAGVDVFLHYNDARDYLAYGQRGKQATGVFGLGGSMGGIREALEWRGRKDAKGQFVPFATIARIALENDNIPKADWQSTLLVTRLDADLKKSCLVALVDARANPEPNALARKIADSWAADATRPCAEKSEDAPFVGVVGDAWKDRKRVDAP